MGQSKLLLAIDGETLLGRVIRTLREGGSDRVLVVAPPADRPDGPAIRALGLAAGAEVIVPGVPPPQMRDSIELAVNRLLHGEPPRFVILTPGDCPGVTRQLVAELLEAVRREPEKMVVPVSHGRRGHPIVLPWDLAAAILRLPEGVGARALLSEHSGRLKELAVSSQDVCADLDTPDDLRRWLDRERQISGLNTEPAQTRSLVVGQPEFLSRRVEGRIRLEVRLFALAKERAERASVEVELLAGARVADLRAEIVRQFPALAPLLPRTMIAVNEEYAADDQILSSDARIAVIPPVSGGSKSGGREGKPGS
jgi:CTP:molybdopterin cytidylyltransferase MocA/molybdopterin converting factor small subunit